MIEHLLIHVMRYGVLIAVLGGAWKARARRWTRLAQAYRAADKRRPARPECCARRHMQTIVLRGGRLGGNWYRCLVTVGVTAEGLLLRLPPPYSLFHPPLLIPFRDFHVEPRRWDVFGGSTEFRLSQVSDVNLIVHDRLLRWVESQAADLPIASREDDEWTVAGGGNDQPVFPAIDRSQSDDDDATRQSDRVQAVIAD